MEDLIKRMSNFFKVLSDPTRLYMIEFLKDNPSTSIQIQDDLNISQSFVSHQLKKLYDNDLIEYEKEGKVKIYKPKNEDIYKLLAIVQSYILKLEKEKFKKFNLINKLESTNEFKDIF